MEFKPRINTHNATMGTIYCTRGNENEYTVPLNVNPNTKRSDPMAFYHQPNPIFQAQEQKYANGGVVMHPQNHPQYPMATGMHGHGGPETALDMYSVPSVIHDAPRWSWCSTVWSVLTCCFCISPLGFLALLFSIFSYTDHKSGDYSRASHKRRCAWGCAMTGIAIGVLVIVAVVLLFIVYMPETATQLCEWGYDNYCGVKCRYLSCWKI